MHGTFHRPGGSYNHVDRRAGLGFFAVPLVLVIAVIVLARIQPAMPTWISEAVQAEFVGPGSVPDVAPTQLALPGTVTRSVEAY